MMKITHMILASSLLLPACFAEDQTAYGGAHVAVGASADLVELGPGVEVIADYDRPIFFADDLYWWNNGGIWFSSTWYGGGWTRASLVSPRVLAIAHPEVYVHYRPAGYPVRHRGSVRVEARDHSLRGGVGIRSRRAPGGGHHR